VPPQQLVFVDDRQVNVDAATAAGLQGIRFTGCAETLETELQKLGLEF
jgi:FMN phosphatase YigB (HAD superfamily)